MKVLAAGLLIFKINGAIFEFSSVEGLSVYQCPEQKCEALANVKKFKKIQMKKVREGMRFANSIGSDVCARVYNAGSILGKNSEGDGRAFCVFRDGSMIEVNSLTSYLQEKKYVSE